MGFIFKEYKPLLCFLIGSVIHLHRNHNRAGIDFIGLFHIVQFAVFFQLSHCHQSQIHQADELIFSSCKNLFSGIQITLVGGFDGRTIITLPKLHICQLCGEGGMTAVVRPVCIQHSDFRHGRISLFILFKILLNM